MGRFFGKAKKAQGLFGGGALIVCALAAMWAGVSQQVKTDGSLSSLAERAMTIDADAPDPNNNGSIVVAAARLRSAELYEDEYLKPSPLLIVKRRVEMYQWVESFKEGSAQPDYSMQWQEGQVDFFKFKVPGGHENPLMQVAPKEFTVQTARFGGFEGGKILSCIKRLETLPVTQEMVKDPAIEIVDGKVYVSRELGTLKPSLGDMRVSYEVLRQGDYTVMSVQQDERSLVGATPTESLFIRDGLFSASELIDDVGEDSKTSFHGMLYLGGLLMFVGSLSIMLPLSSKFDLRPQINLQGALAVMVVSAGLSVVTMVAFFLLSFTR